VQEGTASWRAGDLALGAPGSPAHRLRTALKFGAAGLIMRLRIFDGVIFEISRVLESLFDAIEYRSAIRAEADRQRQKERAQTKQASDPLEYLYPTHAAK
jgi:hypothetical protein